MKYRAAQSAESEIERETYNVMGPLAAFKHQRLGNALLNILQLRLDINMV